MGSLCCRQSHGDIEEYASDPNGCIDEHCFCLRYCFHHIHSMYSAIFYRNGTNGSASTSSDSAGLLEITSSDNSLPDAFRPPPRPLPYDVDPRYFYLQPDRVLRVEKGYLHEDSVSGCRVNDACAEAQSIVTKKTEIKRVQAWRPLSGKTLDLDSAVGLIEDDDVCPTCLDDYTSENPKIATQCGHHFHLACIYEWMERSEKCPVCGKEMVFSENP